jgi:hypothetical protein
MIPHSKQPQSESRSRKVFISIILFLIVFLTYILSPVVQSSDSRLNLYTTMSILKHGNLELDEYAPLLGDYYATERFNGHLYNKYPVGPSLLALPFVWLADTATGGALYDSMHTTWPIALELLIACFIVGLAAVAIFWLARLTLPFQACPVLGDKGR